MNKTEDLTRGRGENYGHPMDQFNVVEEMFQVWSNERATLLNCDFDEREERALRHAVYMILTKLSRACTNPLHMDNWADIKGYAHCFEMCVEQARCPVDDKPVKMVRCQ